MYALVYVDDILIIGSSSKDVDDLIENINNLFALKIPGQVHHFLGIRVTRTHTDLHLCQAKYIKDLQIKAGLQDSKACKTPICTRQKLVKTIDNLFEKGTLYKGMIVAL